MASKKKQDEKHLKVLREMVALAHNKQCFDCHQRGPTYINMTIGSYVCTACSGLLRGLNPPHRVKSISMASFTPDEIEFIKCHGNEYCRKVWLGLYDNRGSLTADGRDESKVKDFMTQKYERKRYYVAPTESMKDEAKSMNESAIASKVPGTKPLKSLLGENAPRIQVGNYQKAAATPPPIHSTPQSPGSTSIQSSKSSGSTAMDLLGDLGGDPFTSSTPQSQASSGGGFADFGNFGNTATSSQPSQPSAFPPSAPLQPAGSGSQPLFNGFGSTPASTAPAPAAPGAGGDKYSNLSDLFSTSSAEENTATSGWSTTLSSSSSGGGLNWGGGAQTSTSTSSGGLNWGGDGNSAGGGGGGVNWNSSSTQQAQPQGGMSWGGPSSASSSWGGAPATAQSNGLGVPGNPFLATTVSNPFGSSSATTLTSQSGFGQAGVPQQPGGGFGQPGFGQPGVPQQQSANPFGGQAVSSSSFGAFGAPNASVSQNAGFGQFGAPTASSVGGFGQFGTPAGTASAGFGQFGVQNGGFGANTPTTGFGGAQPTMSTGFGGQQGFGAGQQAFGQQAPQQQNAGFGGAGFGAQPTQGFPQQQPAGFGGQQAQMQGFGGAQGWGQQMPPSQGSANPFMSTAQQYSNTAPKAGATNPFL